MKNWEAFPSNLRALRVGCRHTQASLARAVGVHKNVIYQYERGTTRPRDASLQKLAAALGCSQQALFGHPTDEHVGLTYTLRENGRTVYYGADIFSCSSQFFAILASVMATTQAGSVLVDISAPTEHDRVYDIHYGEQNDNQAEDGEAV